MPTAKEDKRTKATRQARESGRVSTGEFLMSLGMNEHQSKIYGPEARKEILRHPNVYKPSTIGPNNYPMPTSYAKKKMLAFLEKKGYTPFIPGSNLDVEAYLSKILIRGDLLKARQQIISAFRNKKLGGLACHQNRVYVILTQDYKIKRFLENLGYGIKRKKKDGIAPSYTTNGRGMALDSTATSAIKEDDVFAAKGILPPDYSDELTSAPSRNKLVPMAQITLEERRRILSELDKKVDELIRGDVRYNAHDLINRFFVNPAGYLHLLGAKGIGVKEGDKRKMTYGWSPKNVLKALEIEIYETERTEAIQENIERDREEAYREYQKRKSGKFIEEPAEASPRPGILIPANSFA